MSPRSVKAGIVQQRCDADPQRNLAHTGAQVAELAQAGARLILLQELHNGPYPAQSTDPTVFDGAEPVPGPTTERLGEWARAHQCVIVGSVFERRGGGVHHNTAVVLDSDGSLAGRYRKMHVPEDPGYHEKYYFTPGEATGPEGGFEPIDTAVGRLGVLVCWDQWFPEAARLMALAGAEVLLYPTAIGWAPEDSAAERARQSEAWVTVQRSHAVANQVPVLVANRAGYEPAPQAPGQGIEFWGQSFAAGAQGEILAQAPNGAQAALCVDLVLGERDALSRVWPFFRDRRVEAYGGLLKRFIAD